MKKSFMYLMTAVTVVALSFSVTSCSKDNDDISKSDLIGTWYTLEDDWVLVFTQSEVTQYELMGYPGNYHLNSYTLTYGYTLNGNIFTNDEGSSATITINNNKLYVTNGKESITYTKYNGTPKQLIDYLNNLAD